LSGSPRLPLSIDWEDWYQLCLPGFDAHDRFENRLEIATDRTLELCEDLAATGTWFCLADQARRQPHLVRRIAQAGHRIGVHGLTHVRAFELERGEWCRQISMAKAELEDLCGQRIEGYRAAEWSLRGDAESWWEELPAMGFTYDASRAPLNVVGNPDWPRRPYRLREDLWEIPPPVCGPMPIWGWGLRSFPVNLTQPYLHRLAAQDAGTPIVLHPWELDEGQPALPSVPWGHAFTHKVGLPGFGSRLRQLCHGLTLEPIEAWVARRLDQGVQ
jgi:polysaccharide deacetylase family protein (PEP-CTERM system associated)